eukprot:Gb_37828 [translate_table: standard]
MDNRQRLSIEDFTVISVIGEGNMGKVFLAKMKNKSKPLAMKAMKKEANREHRLLRAKKEAEILSLLSHPFLPSLTASFESDKHFFTVTNFCSGGDLNVLRQKLRHKKFPEAAAMFYAAEVLVALEYLHGLGIVYGDLKPENVLIQDSGHVVLTDFDLSIRLVHNENGRDAYGWCESCIILPILTAVLTKKKKNRRPDPTVDSAPRSKYRPATVVPDGGAAQQSFFGTEEYVAPEVLRRTGHGFPLDWWTFGIFIYELVFGKTPFKGPNRDQTFSNILNRQQEFPKRLAFRPPVDDLIDRLLMKDPSKRLGSSPRGVEEIKKHAFFKSIRWDDLEKHHRPPFVPSPFSLEAASKRCRFSIEDT